MNPTLALIEELVKRGEEVVYYCVEEYKEKIEKQELCFVHMKIFSKSRHVEKDEWRNRSL